MPVRKAAQDGAEVSTELFVPVGYWIAARVSTSPGSWQTSSATGREPNAVGHGGEHGCRGGDVVEAPERNRPGKGKEQDGLPAGAPPDPVPDQIPRSPEFASMGTSVGDRAPFPAFRTRDGRTPQGTR